MVFTILKTSMNVTRFVKHVASVVGNKYLHMCQVRNIGKNPLHAVHIDLRQFGTTPSLLKKKKKKHLSLVAEVPDSEWNENEEENILEDPEYDLLTSSAFVPGKIKGQDGVSGVMVLQPWVKWGPRKRLDTNGELLLDEAAALISTLPMYKVVAKEVVHVKSTETKGVFGTGTLERLASEIRSLGSCSTVFVSLDILKSKQVQELESIFRVRVIDRYSVVLGIFHLHAQTLEARMQLALAEIPYMRSRVHGEREKNMLKEREKKLSGSLNKLKGKREILRRGRINSSIPSVAILGYTNAGKTSLIRAITGDKRAEGKDQLFATLDVTAHGGHLPCGVEVVFIDTVGFIQDIPTSLIASFRATLEDAICADVVIHVRDASHPDYRAQGQTVEKTLSSLPLDAKTPVIAVGNKMDIVTPDKKVDLEGALPLSSLTGHGLQEVLMVLEQEILRVTNRHIRIFKLPSGCENIRWLRKVTGISKEEVDPEDSQNMLITVAISEQELAAYRRFIKDSG
ncbi:putative GTP-binding protein 6 isoform X1 [Oratosquilla oratoria]|uniref:putative GTP-binding protein 6 isoform X1 n=1 Tax=Oratosquilla oratoria TaxID=337810 RepID=UPI003F7691A5